MALKDFTLLAKMEALDLEGHKYCQKFNKAERHVLSAEIRHTNAALLHLIIQAAKTQIYERKMRRPPARTRELLWQADVELEYLRLQVRKSFNLRLVNEGAYERWIRMVLEVGGLLGGWIKTVNNAVETPPPRQAVRKPQPPGQGSLLG